MQLINRERNIDFNRKHWLIYGEESFNITNYFVRQYIFKTTIHFLPLYNPVIVYYCTLDNIELCCQPCNI